MSTGPTIFYVRAMVCPRCILMVRRILTGLGLTPVRVELGEVEVAQPATTVPWPALAEALTAVGFALLHPPARQLAYRLDALVTEVLQTDPQRLPLLSADGLAARLGCTPAALRAACRAELGAHLAPYLVRRRIEAVQRVLRSRPAVSVQDAARRLGYSSQAHLCRQFRAATGLTPTAWRRAQPGALLGAVAE